MKFDLHSRWVPPARVSTLETIPLSQQQLYDREPLNHNYRLHAGGVVLSRLREAALHAGFNLTVLPPAKDGKMPAISGDQWKKTISAATPTERRVLLVAAARGELSIGK
ncbi:conserved protein of unknown function [Hyphomicrobium sp. 1Nfss2.1]|uniref:hypothetical protein n=1 Tax=Hyphomicrobium sp. 1Nfss2.1 TaxID=3413936 RepID=UPI003C7D6287